MNVHQILQKANMSGEYAILKNRLSNPFFKLSYVIEPADWAIKWIWTDVTLNLNNQRLLRARTTTTHKGIYNQILHFGSRNVFLPVAWKKVDKSNKIIFTWFHGTEKDKTPANLAMIKALPQASQKADAVHTPCTLSKEKLIRWGVPENKIVVVPLGVDLNIFKPVTEARKNTIRKELGLPQDKVIIGSFQKDGVGWGEGLEPKWIKGPDIFVEVVEKLKECNIFVLLLGPARGYVKRELDRIGILYKLLSVNHYEIPKYYNALDLYLVTSREEGGPQAILESMASGIPIVSTKVGMAPDIIKGSYNGFLTEIEDVMALSEKASRIIEDKNLASRVVKNALNTAKDYSWEEIVREYYKKIYSRFLDI